MNKYIINDIIKEFIYKNFGLVIMILLTSLSVYTINSIYIPLILVDISSSNNSEELNNNIKRLIILWSLSQIIYSIYEYIVCRLEPLLNKHISNIILQKIFNKYKYDYMNINSSELFNKIKTIQHNIELFFERMISIMIPRFLIISFIIFNLYNLNHKIGIYLTIVFLLFLLFMYYKSSNNINIVHDENKTIDDIYLKLDDKIKNIQIISSISHGIDKEIKECDKLTDKLLKKSLETTQEGSHIKIIPNIFNGIVLGLILYILKNAAGTFGDKDIDNKKIITILLSMFPLFEHLAELAYYIPELINFLGILKNNDNFINSIFKPNLSINKKLLKYKFNDFSIKFDNVSFSYLTNKYILYNFSFNIDNQSQILLYGKSGSGKTTFIKLLLGIIKPNKGNIYLGNYNIKDIDHDTIFKYIAYLPQSLTTLFDNTIYYNLSYGNNLTKQQIHDFIIKNNIFDIFKSMNNNDNMDYMEKDVGSYGTNLSGGQRQVINIIRTILNIESKIIIFDEPTIGLDINYKHKIIDLIKNINNKTIIMISHDEYVLQKYNNKLKFEYMNNPIHF